MYQKGLTLKRQQFAKKFVELEGNGREAVKQVFNVSSDNSASSYASQLLSSPKVREYIALLIEQQEGGKDTEIIKRMIKRAKQMNSLGQRADETLLRLKGYFDNSGEKAVVAYFEKIKK